MRQSKLDGLPENIRKLIKTGEAIDAELHLIAKEKKRLEIKEGGLLQSKAKLLEKAERGNARPGTPGLAGTDTGGTPMSKFEDTQSIAAGQPKVTDFEKTEPQWLSLFYQTPGEQDYSALMHIEDIAPKFTYGRFRRSAEGTLPVQERGFSYSVLGLKKEYIAVITPARLKASKGAYKDKYIDFYPGELEEIILDILRKKAAEGAGVVLDGLLGISFYIREIRTELKSMNRSANNAEVKHALKVLNGSRIDYFLKGGNEPEFSEPILPTLGFGGKAAKERAFCRFSTLTANALQRAAYRMYNHRDASQYSGEGHNIARVLHKRIVMRFRQLGKKTPFECRMNKFLKNGFTVQARFANNVTAMMNGIQHLINAGRILPWYDPAGDEKREDGHIPNDRRETPESYYFEVVDEKTGKKDDAVFFLYPTDKFVAEMKKANALEKIRHVEICREKDNLKK